LIIEFFVDGAGDPVVLLPGGGLDVGYVADFARRLAGGGFRAVAVNPRGAGASTGPLDGLTLSRSFERSARTDQRSC
jgi:pimeloyl-ACP methyl ester carboxylesterase